MGLKLDITVKNNKNDKFIDTFYIDDVSSVLRPLSSQKYFTRYSFTVVTKWRPCLKAFPLLLRLRATWEFEIGCRYNGYKHTAEKIDSANFIVILEKKSPIKAAF